MCETSISTPLNVTHLDGSDAILYGNNNVGVFVGSRHAVVFDSLLCSEYKSFNVNLNQGLCLEELERGTPILKLCSNLQLGHTEELTLRPRPEHRVEF